ncbi:MAG: hypothetical protein Q8K45_09375 [Rubrivivax sp.]|nr:hypothetical protein [Rubrivivax sp.]
MRPAPLLLRAVTKVIGHMLAASLLATLPALAAEAADSESARLARERAAILVERERLEAQFAEEQARCASRFAVTACLEDVRERRRAALEGPRARALAMDDAERRRRAVERREALAKRQHEAALRPPPAVLPAAPGSASASQPPLPAEPDAAPTSGGAVPTPRAAAASAAAETAALKRAAATRRREAALRAERERIEARQVERARRGKPSAPLPVPAASAPR